MMKKDAIIYEHSNSLSVIQRARQDQREGQQGPSENTALAGKASLHDNAEVIGAICNRALDAYDVVPPKYDPWELKELRKDLCKWIGIKSFSNVVKDTRLVLVVRDEQNRETSVIPFDNHNSKPWEEMLVDQAIKLPFASTDDELGNAVKLAFEIATYHPQKKSA
jgi:transposase